MINLAPPPHRNRINHLGRQQRPPQDKPDSGFLASSKGTNMKRITRTLRRLLSGSKPIVGEPVVQITWDDIMNDLDPNWAGFDFEGESGGAR